MRSLWKLVVLLFCVQRGEGRWLRSLLEPRGQPASPQSGLPEKEEERGGGAREDEGGSGKQWARVPRSRRSADGPCSLRSILIQVSELGLGYDSDETVLFKYCSGLCPRVPSNHDLTLANLLLSGALPAPVPGELWPNTPCCRPTRHQDMAFLDNAHRWHKVEKLSAAACSCVG